MVNLKACAIVKSGKILLSLRDYPSAIDLVDEVEFFHRMLATNSELVITFV